MRQYPAPFGYFCRRDIRMGRNIKFLMINPTSPHWRAEAEKGPGKRTRAFRFSMHTSLAVSAAMPPCVETRILDEDVEPVDFDTDADLIGISFMTYNAPRAYEISHRFRHEKKRPVIFGGFHPTFMPEEAIEYADAICIGEAEYNAPKMIADYAAGRLKRFYKSGLADMKGLPIADRRLIRKSAYITPDTIQATRGCPNRCKFCSISAFYGHRFRSRPVDEVLYELGLLGRYVMFLDDNITADRGYAKELFSKMIPLEKRWFSQCTIGIANDSELLRLAYASGCRGMFVGLESLSDENLKACNKHFNKAGDYTRAIDRIHSMGIAVYAGIVFGMDNDGPGVFSETLSFLYRAKVDALQATILTPFPGTQLFYEMDTQGRITNKDWGNYDFGHVVFEPKNMSAETLKSGHDWVLTQFYSRRSIVRRMLYGVGYLSPSIMIRGVVPLNIGYRSRLRAEGTLWSGSAPAHPRHTLLPASSSPQRVRDDS
jgi:radical SAM superfamily enzyme YgiQ (UPF0313 family)